MTLTGFFTLQLQLRNIASINLLGATGSGAAVGADYLLADAWSEALNDHDSASFTAHKTWDDTRWQATDALSYRVQHRVDFQHPDDFHYTGLTGVISNNTYLGVVPENFTAQTVGLAVLYTF